MKIVAVSQRIDDYPDRNERRDAIDQKLIQFLLTANYISIPVPNSLLSSGNNLSPENNALETWLNRIKPQAILLSGGNDIDSCKDRDFTESGLLNYAKNNQLPVLGICRGMQMIAIWSGTKLKTVHNHVATRHFIKGKITQEVNSYHNQAIAKCPNNFSILAESENDSVIEAIAHNSLPWQGWMWHPEREETFSSEDISRLKALFG